MGFALGARKDVARVIEVCLVLILPRVKMKVMLFLDLVYVLLGDEVLRLEAKPRKSVVRYLLRKFRGEDRVSPAAVLLKRGPLSFSVVVGVLLTGLN